MKIVAPASSIEEVKRFNELGVEEIYMGLKTLPEEERKNKKWNSVNERFEKKGNFEGIEELKKAYEINKKSENPAELSLTVNRAFYTDEQFKRAIQQVEETKNYIDNYIIADPSLIDPIKRIAPDKNLKLSCISVCLNSEAAKFFKEKGIKRIALPRHLTIGEIREIKNNIDIDLEVMGLNQYCRNMDGFCSRCHVPSQGQEIFLPNCNIPFKHKIFNIKSNKKEMETAEKNISSILRKFKPFCGICFLKKLQEIGINHLKIVGRNNSTERKVKDVKFIKRAISFDEKNYEEKCKALFKERFGFKCYNNCYFE